MPNGTVISAQNLGRISCERLSEHTVREWYPSGNAVYDEDIFSGGSTATPSFTLYMYTHSLVLVMRYISSDVLLY